MANQLHLQPVQVTQQGVEQLLRDNVEKQEVCLLDPKAERDLTPDDRDAFRVFLFGGILGDDPPRGR